MEDNVPIPEVMNEITEETTAETVMETVIETVIDYLPTAAKSYIMEETNDPTSPADVIETAMSTSTACESAVMNEIIEETTAETVMETVIETVIDYLPSAARSYIMEETNDPTSPDDVIETALSTSTACEIFPSLTLPTPLQPIFPTPNALISPLFLLAVAMMLVSLLFAHKFSRTPLEQIGQVGPRGRKHYSWNESITGGCGGRFTDWWIFGGSVWIRAALCLWDAMAGTHSEGGEQQYESSGENIFACFGVAANKPQQSAVLVKSKKSVDVKDYMSHAGGNATGIIGYDSSLGGFGPICLAPIRASVFLIGWCSVCSFLRISYNELLDFATKLSNPTSKGYIQQIPLTYRDHIGNVVLSILHFIQSTMNIGSDLIRKKSDSLSDSWLQTIVYAFALVVSLEICMYFIGKTFMLLRLYVPKGVSHPGGARPHKIVRTPKWAVGEHFLSHELLSGKCNNDSEEESGVSNSKWRCAVAHDSHRDTMSKFDYIKSKECDDDPFGLMTGEPFGRQIWTLNETLPSLENKVSEDDMEDKLKQELVPNYKRKKKKKTENKEENIFSPIGDLVQNIFSFDAIDSQYDEKAELIERLASGGRNPMAFEPSKNPNSCDQIFRAQMISSYLEKNDDKFPEDIAYLQDKGQNGRVDPPKTALEAAKRGIAFYSLLQSPDGHWAGDYGGPHFLLPGLVVAWYVMGCPSVMISPPQQMLMLHYFKVHQQADGGWGTHIESPSTMFGTVICYLAARLLGADKDEDWIKSGRSFIQKEGGAVMTSSWAKFWLCLVGCMDWKGHNSVPPEMWLLPNWCPFHPGRLWCHARMVYLPFGYLYGSRFVYSQSETDPLIEELRDELYCEPYDSIDWDRTRHLVATMDNYSPIPKFMKFAQNCLSVYENWKVFRPFRDAIRKAGLDFCLEYMRAEDLQTNFIDIGPVNKALNMVCAFHAANSDINDPAVRSHMMRVPDYLWLAEDGMKMQGYNGSQCWDTSFAIQAVWECGLLDRFPILSAKVWAFLERTQILSTECSQTTPAYQYESCDSRDRFYRHVSKGGWPFSTSAHGWPISDCTGEGLKGVLALMDSPIVMEGVKRGVLKDIEPSRLYDAVNVILTLQNDDGGWATYENNRGFGCYEELNPSEVFGDIMIDYSYVECSMASLTALVDFHEKFPDHRPTEITFAIQRGAEFIKSIQRKDGSW